MTTRLFCGAGFARWILLTLITRLGILQAIRRTRSAPTASNAWGASSRHGSNEEASNKMRLVIALLLVVFILALFLSNPSPAAYASEARCVNTLITSPAAHSVLSGVVNINGTAQLVGAFVRYQVDFSTMGLNLWVTLNSAPQAVVNGTLARWDTSLVPDGEYDLRVRSVDTSGNYCEMLVSPITVKKGASNIFSNTKLVAQPVASTIEIKTLSGEIQVPIPAAPTIPYCTSAAYLGSVVTH